jgi:hypothetical protein
MTGVDRFMAALKDLGLECEQRGQLVVVTLDVSPLNSSGRHQVGADPPNDFPNVPPHWLHLRSDLALPQGGAQASELGTDWRKWSRPHPKWVAGAGGREWVSHARSLLLVASRG